MWCKTALSATLVLALVLPAHAADESLEASAPVGPAVGPAELIDADVLSFVKSMEAQLNLHAKAPRHTETDHGLYDLWHAIVRPRIGRMLRRVKELQKPQRWIRNDAGAVLGLAPDAWSRTVRDMAALYAELGSMRKRYERATISFTSPYGLGLDRPADIHVGYPLEQLGPIAMGRELHRRLRSGRILWRDEVRAYRHLLGRFHLYYVRTAHLWQRIRVPGEPDEMRKAHEAHEHALDLQRDSLQMQMIGLQTLMATLQITEEDRLLALVELGLDAGATARVEALTLLGQMRRARLDGREFEGEKLSEYGQRLRHWSGARTKLLAKLPK